MAEDQEPDLSGFWISLNLSMVVAAKLVAAIMVINPGLASMETPFGAGASGVRECIGWASKAWWRQASGFGMPWHP